MVVTLKKHKGKVVVEKRAYHRIKPTKKQMRVVHKTGLLVLILALIGIYQITYASNDYIIEYRDVVKERIIWVEKVQEEPMTVEQQIRAIAKEKNFKWENYLVNLAKCESDLKPKAINDQNNTPKGSIDRGLFMANNFWHPEISDECAFSVRCSTEFAINLINKGRQSEFICDRYIK